MSDGGGAVWWWWQSFIFGSEFKLILDFIAGLKMLFLYVFVEEEFIWCYKDEKCDQFAWNKNVPVSYLYEFRHI